MSGYYAPPTQPGYANLHQTAYGQPMQYASPPNTVDPNTLQAQNPQQSVYGWNQTTNYQAYLQQQPPASPVGPPNGYYGMQNAMSLSTNPAATANNRPLPLPSPGAPAPGPASPVYASPPQFNPPVNNQQTGYFPNPSPAYPYHQQQPVSQPPVTVPPSQPHQTADEAKRALYERARMSAMNTARRSATLPTSELTSAEEAKRLLYEKAQRMTSHAQQRGVGHPMWAASQVQPQQQAYAAHPMGAANVPQGGSFDNSTWSQSVMQGYPPQQGVSTMQPTHHAHALPPAQRSYHQQGQYSAQYVPTGHVASLINGIQNQSQSPYGSYTQAAMPSVSPTEDVPPPPPPKSTSPTTRSGTSPSGSGITKRALPASPSLPPAIPSQTQGRQPSPFQHQSTQSLPTLSTFAVQNVGSSGTPSPATPIGSANGTTSPTKRSLPAAPGAGGITIAPGTSFSPPPVNRGSTLPSLMQSSSFQLPASPTASHPPSSSPNQTTPTSNSFPANVNVNSSSSSQLPSTSATDNRASTPSQEVPTSAPSSYASARSTFSFAGPTNPPYSAPSSSPPPTGAPRSTISEGGAMARNDTGGSASGSEDKRPLWKRMAAAAGGAGPIGSRPKSVFGQHRVSASFSGEPSNSAPAEKAEKVDVKKGEDGEGKTTTTEEKQTNGGRVEASSQGPASTPPSTVRSPPPTAPSAAPLSSLPSTSPSSTQPSSSTVPVMPPSSAPSATTAPRRPPLPVNPSGSNIPLNLHGASASQIPQISQVAKARPVPTPPTTGVVPGHPVVPSQPSPSAHSVSTASISAPPPSVPATQQPQQIRYIQTQPKGPDAKPAPAPTPASNQARTPASTSNHSRTQSVPATAPTPPSRPQTTPLPVSIPERNEASSSQSKTPIDANPPKPRVLQKKRPEEKTKQQPHSSFTTPRYQVPLKPAADEMPTRPAATTSASPAPPKRPASAGSARTTASAGGSGESPQISMALRFASQDLVKQVKKDKDWAKWALVTGHQVATNPVPIDGIERTESGRKKRRSMSTGAVERVDLDDEPPRPKSVVIGGDRKAAVEQAPPAIYTGHERDRSQDVPLPQQPIKSVHASSAMDGAVLVNTPNGMRRGGARPMPSSRPTSWHNSRVRSGSLDDGVNTVKDFPQYRPSYTDSDSDDTNDGHGGSANRTITMSGPAPQISVTHHDAGSVPNARARSGSSPVPPPPAVVVPSINIDGADDDDGPPAITITIDEPSSQSTPAPNVPVFSFSGPDDEPSTSSAPVQSPEGKEKKKKKLHKREKSVKEEEDERERLRQLARTRPLPPKIKKNSIRCGKCDKNIMGRIVSAMNARWHPECFRCTVCETFLEHVSSYEHDDRPYCHLDYHELFAPRCYHCKTPIMEEHFITLDDEALGKRTYHEQHFFCAECGDPFLAPKQQRRTKMLENGTIQILDQEDDVGFTVYKGHAYCEACHVRLRMPKCKRCKKSIRPGDQAIEAMGGKWCWSCFTCERCRKPFEDPQFYEHEKKPYCHQCYGIILVNQFD